MALLARQGNRVLYVDPGYSNGLNRWFPKQGYRVAYGFRVRQVAENLWVMRPPFPLPLGRWVTGIEPGELFQALPPGGVSR